MEIRKTEIFAKILDIVANETELTSEQILSCCRTAETVDARYMLVHLLRREGIYISEIARMMHFSRRGIEKMLSQFEDRRGCPLKQGRRPVKSEARQHRAGPAFG